jgi:hypothetical protein
MKQLGLSAAPRLKAAQIPECVRANTVSLAAPISTIRDRFLRNGNFRKWWALGSCVSNSSCKSNIWNKESVIDELIYRLQVYPSSPTVAEMHQANKLHHNIIQTANGGPTKNTEKTMSGVCIENSNICCPKTWAEPSSSKPLTLWEVDLNFPHLE